MLSKYQSILLSVIILLSTIIRNSIAEGCSKAGEPIHIDQMYVFVYNSNKHNLFRADDLKPESFDHWNTHTTFRNGNVDSQL
jgi:hypothetical protein